MAKDYSKWTKEQLIAEIENLRKRKKFGVVWENQKEDLVKKSEKQIPILHQVKGLEIATNPNKPINYLIEGDNYHALSVLNYTHKNKVDVIYIDPPYNTGNKSWRYNNNYIDKEDSYRHSKWLSFMNKRLKMARNLLKRDGIIVATIDDYEVANLMLLMDEIFGEFNRLGVVTIMHHHQGRSDDKHIATAHEYALFYAFDKSKCETWNVTLTEEQIEEYPEKDEISFYRNKQLRRTATNSTPDKRPNLFYPIFWNEKTNEIQVEKQEEESWKKIEPLDPKGIMRVWRWGKETLMQRAETEIVIKKVNGKPELFSKSRITDGRKPKTVWADSKYSAGSHGTSLLTKLLGKHDTFDYPKSIYAVLDTLEICCGGKKNAVVLDFFAGSGTTGHAVALLNEKDGGNRQFILCTDNENGIAKKVCYAKIKAVTKKNKKLSNITGIDINLKYLKTDFIDLELTDEGKYKLSREAVGILCLREDSFEELLSSSNSGYRIFKNGNKHFGVLFNDNSIENFKTAVKKINRDIAVYRFTYTKNYFDERFDDLDNMTDLFSIPEGILQNHYKIFHQRNKEEAVI